VGLRVRLRVLLVAVALAVGLAGPALAQDTSPIDGSTDPVPSSVTSSEPSDSASPPNASTSIDGPATIVIDPNQQLQPALGEEAGTASPGPALRGEARQVGAPLPPDPDLSVPENSGEGRRVVYSNARQRIWVIDESGALIKTHRVSGRTGWPGIGTYTVYSRSLNTYATHNPSIIWKYMIRFATGPNGGAIGFHEIPTQCISNSCQRVQTDEQLGQPLSGGCVRQKTEDAIWMWEWAQIGTKVVVIDNG
jgi:lipoprotein-anchoring transpeptidase ErfK/SrfK